MAYCFSHGPSRTAPWVPPHLQPSHTQKHTPPKHPRRHASVVPPHLRQPSSSLRLAPFDHNHFHEPSTAHKYSCHRIEDIGGLSKKNSSLDTHTTMPHYNQNFPYESFLRPAPRHTTRPQFPESHVPPHLRKNLVQTQAKRPLHRQRAHVHHGGTQKQKSPSCQYALDSFGSNSDWDLIRGYEGSDELGSTAHHVGRACIVVGAPISSRNIGEEHIAAIQASQQEREFEDAAISKEIMEFVVEAECATLEDHSGVVDFSAQTMENVCFVAEDPISPPCAIGEELIIVDAPLANPFGDSILPTDQHLLEKKIEVIDAANSEEKTTKSAPSPCLERAMQCLELQRKNWDMGSLMSVVPAVPTVQFVDPFLAPMKPQIKLANCVFGCLESGYGEQSIFIDLWGSRQANRCCREDSGLSRREAPTAPIGSWFALWRPPDLDYFVVLSGYWFSCCRPPDLLFRHWKLGSSIVGFWFNRGRPPDIWAFPRVHCVASRTKPFKRGWTDAFARTKLST